ncbi:hypothetical protein N665_0012s0136 [Sinapis alba]|nr:hypothetical protein N665_0012s0136 [Sinapis alba]
MLGSLHLYQMESMARETICSCFLKRWAFQSQGDLIHSSRALHCYKGRQPSSLKLRDKS